MASKEGEAVAVVWLCDLADACSTTTDCPGLVIVCMALFSRNGCNHQATFKQELSRTMDLDSVLAGSWEYKILLDEV